MSRFETSKGFVFNITLTVGDLRRVREATGVDLGAAMTDEKALIEVVFGNPEKLVEILYLLCEEQCKAGGTDPEAFARQFDGATLERSIEALLGAVADFFPRSAIGAALKRNLPRTLANLDAMVIASMDAKASKPSAGNSQPAPASTRGP